MKRCKIIILSASFNLTDWIDSSGIRFLITPDLRPMDAGVIELGLEYTDKMAIPPTEENFPLTGYCVSECTAVVSILNFGKNPNLN